MLCLFATIRGVLSLPNYPRYNGKAGSEGFCTNICLVFEQFVFLNVCSKYLQPSEEFSACQTIHVMLGRQGQRTFLAPISVWYLSSIFLIFVPVFGIIIYLSACQTIQMMLGELFDQFCNICAIFKLYLC